MAVCGHGRRDSVYSQFNPQSFSVLWADTILGKSEWTSPAKWNQYAPSRALGHMHILIADDEPDLRDTLKLLLELRGHRISLAVDGQDAVNIATETRPDVVLMDVRMPVMDGVTATRLL